MRKGQSLVESALAILVFVMAVLMVVDFSLIAFTQQTLTERVRSAARKAAVSNLPDDAVIQEVLDRNRSAGTGIGSLTTANVKVERLRRGTASESVRVSIVGFQYPVVSLIATSGLAARTISHTEPVEHR